MLAYLDQAHPLHHGNECRLLRDGVEAYPAMLAAIHGAQRRVWLETYMFVDDAVGALFGRALAEAAERGVKVTVLYDWLGSWGTSRSFFRSLRSRGVDVRPFKPFSLSRGLGRLIRRDHRKLLIVDGAVAFVGGVNIASHWAPRGEQGDGWRDDVLRIEGPAVAPLERTFSATWRMQWKDRLRRLRRAPARLDGPVKGKVSLSVLSSRRGIHSAYLQAIAAARFKVMIVAAYFVPDRKMLAALKAAASRGVEVALVMAGTSDHPIVTFASRAFYGRLMGWGVRVFEWRQGVLHAKTAVVDSTWGTIGSFNLERTSLRLNHELNVVFSDPRLGKQLEDSFVSDCALCHPIDPGTWHLRPLWRRVLERLAYLLRKGL